MVNQRLLEGTVRKNMGGYSRVDGNVLQGEYRVASVAHAVDMTQRDTVGQDGVPVTVQQTIVTNPVAGLDLSGVNTTTVSPNVDSRPALVAEGNADSGSTGKATDAVDMVAGDQLIPTDDARASVSTTTEVVETAANGNSGLTEKQKNIAMGLGLLVLIVGGYFVVKKFNK